VARSHERPQRGGGTRYRPGNVEDASKWLNDERKTGRDKILEDVAVQRIPAETARNALEMLAWADGALYHAWRLAESLRIASGGRRTPDDDKTLASEGTR
jgi:hypothetical protein